MSDFTMSNPPEHQFPNHHNSMVSPNLSNSNSSYNPRQPPRSPVENFYHSSNSSSMQYPAQEDLFGRLSIGNGIPPPPLPSGLAHYSTTNPNTNSYQMQPSSTHTSFSGPSSNYMNSNNILGNGGVGGSGSIGSTNSSTTSSNSATSPRRRRSSIELQTSHHAPHHHHQRSSSNGTVYEFVSLPASQNNKRPRRKYEEIERIYNCNFVGCSKAYGTLNHLNAHVTMQRHGNKRTPDEFRETRRLWKLRKKERQMTAGQPSTSTSTSNPNSNSNSIPSYGGTTLSRPPPPPSGTTLLPPLPPSPISVHSTSPVSSYFSRPPTGATTTTTLPPTPSSMSMPMYGTNDVNHMKYMNHMNSTNTHMPYTHQPPTNYESSQYYREEMS